MLLTEARLVLVGLGALTALGACDCDGAAPVDASVDAQVDAGDRDSGERDGGRDAGDDGGDAGRTDTSWIPLDGLPPGCVIERAENPETVFRNVWEPCADAPSSCRRLADTPGLLRAVDARVGDFESGVGVFSLVVGVRVGDPRVVTLATTDGRVLGAWREPRSSEPGVCLSSVGTGDAHGALRVAVRQGTGLHEEHFFGGELMNMRAPPHLATLTASDIPGTNSTQSLAVSDTGFAAEIQLGGFIWYFEGPERRRLSGIDSAVPGIPQNVQLVGGHVLWEAWDATVEVAHGSLTDPDEVFLEVPGGDLRGFAADRDDMAWQQMYDRQPDGTFLRHELWTSPYARRPEDLRPRQVTTLPTRYPIVRMGGGFYGFLSSRAPDAYTFVHLSDGAKRVLASDDFVGFQDHPLAVSATAVMVSGSRNDNGELRVYELASLPSE